MKLMVPTLWCMAMLTAPIEVAGQRFGAGEMVRIPYGVALMAFSLGVVTVIQDAEQIHAEATEVLQKYGPDSWFPQPVQTISKVGEWLASLSKAQNDAPEGPRNAIGEPIH
jgi:hypothetical protein